MDESIFRGYVKESIYWGGVEEFIFCGEMEGYMRVMYNIPVSMERWRSKIIGLRWNIPHFRSDVEGFVFC